MDKPRAPPAYDEIQRGSLTPSAPPSYEQSLEEVTSGFATTNITITAEEHQVDKTQGGILPEKFAPTSSDTGVSTSTSYLSASSSSNTTFPSHLSFLGIDDNPAVMKKIASDSNLAKQKTKPKSLAPPETKPRSASDAGARNAEYLKQKKAAEKEAKIRLIRQTSWSKPETLPWYLRDSGSSSSEHCCHSHCHHHHHHEVCGRELAAEIGAAATIGVIKLIAHAASKK